MIASKYLGCHSRQNGNPETKNRNHWIPASAGTTKPDKFLVIPGKPEIQIANTGFPRIEYGAGSVKLGMTIKVKGLLTQYTIASFDYAQDRFFRMTL